MSGAIFSPCGRFRYRLERDIGLDGIVIAYFGVNPSGASAHCDDATSRKWIGFAKLNGARRYLAGNPFARVSTDVAQLQHVEDPIGPDNELHLYAIIAEADILIPCWGNRGKLPSSLRPRLDELSVRLHASGKPVKVFGFTKGGDPAHPLMLAYSTPLIEWARGESAVRRVGMSEVS